MKHKTMEMIEEALDDEAYSMSADKCLDAVMGNFDGDDLADAVQMGDDFFFKRGGDKTQLPFMIAYLFNQLVADGRISIKLEFDILDKQSGEVTSGETVGVKDLSADEGTLRFRTTRYAEPSPQSLYVLEFTIPGKP